MTTGWRSAVCVEARLETPTARSIRLRVDDLDEVLAGQHIDVRLTADDGYQAVRSYSLSAGPDGGPSGRRLAADEVELTVEELEGGEVSPYLVEGLEPGDPVEVRGPMEELVRLAPDRHPARAADRRRLRSGAAHGDDPRPRRRGLRR